MRRYSLNIELLSTALKAVMIGVLMLAVAACSSTKHVPQGKYLLDNVKINIEDNENNVSQISKSDLTAYLRQNENHKVMGGLKLQLAIYNLSGKDSTSRFNKWLQRIGTAPVIYDSALTAGSVKQLNLAISNKGYMKNKVESDVTLRPDKKARVVYNITLGEPYIVRDINYDIPDTVISQIILADTADTPVKRGSVFDHNLLENWRSSITDYLRDKGYYGFGKEHISFVADTAINSREVDITLTVSQPRQNSNLPFYDMHRPFYVRNVTFVTNYDAVTMHDGKYSAPDTTYYDGYTILYNKKLFILRRVMSECCFIKPGEMYSARNINRTYRALGRLGILKFINVETQPVGVVDGKNWLDVFILFTSDKPQNISLSLEGTNSEGDLGFGVGLNYQHRNLFNGAEVLSTKFKMSYESISGDLSGLINDNYSEYSAEIGITYPKFKAPLLSSNFKRRIQASTEFHSMFDYQLRPEYKRLIVGAGWKYIWSEASSRRRHTFNFIDLNYVYLPESRVNFLNDITNPLLRYSYEDHFIMRMGYSFYKTNKSQSTLLKNRFQSNIYTIRAGAEIAGNLLYIGSKIFSKKPAADEAYKVFGIRYSQYAKAEADFSLTHHFSTRSSLALHVGAGVAVPYGNSIVVPFEKRFYAGGANGVRGWSVRTLGPGAYNASNLQNSFIYQCGDIRLDASMEFRTKVFWVIELAAFIDAGNIWTIREYDDQPAGQFKFNTFYKQIAASYGVGVRLDFTYFLLRLDMGMKAHNPAIGQEKWPFIHPNFSRDAAFHFSVGYPF